MHALRPSLRHPFRVTGLGFQDIERWVWIDTELLLLLASFFRPEPVFVPKNPGCIEPLPWPETCDSAEKVPSLVWQRLPLRACSQSHVSCQGTLDSACLSASSWLKSGLMPEKFGSPSLKNKAHIELYPTFLGKKTCDWAIGPKKVNLSREKLPFTLYHMFPSVSRSV